MPTSAAGSRSACLIASRRPAAHGAPRGFTLIELLVVIAIIAIAMAGVGLALRDSGSSRLDREAERLAALFEAGRAQSRASGIPVRWRLVEGGFVFEGIEADALPRYWLDGGVQVLAIAANGVRVPSIQLGPEPIIPAQQVLLGLAEAPERSLWVATDGLRPFTVRAP